MNYESLNFCTIERTSEAKESFKLKKILPLTIGDGILSLDDTMSPSIDESSSLMLADIVLSMESLSHVQWRVISDTFQSITCHSHYFLVHKVMTLVCYVTIPSKRMYCI